MWKTFDKQAQKIEDETPDDRNRYADFLRVVSIIMVVLGHWVVAYITIDDGYIVGARLLAVVPETQWLTWIFQVMPIFFFVGGLANAISWDSAQERGETYVDWLRRRGRRLLWPVVPLIVIWAPLVLILDATGIPTYLVIVASQVVLLPIWFLAAYMAVVSISPAAYWLHRQLGVWVLVIFAVLALIVDLLVGAGIEWAGWANFLWVWGAIHQAGFFWHDGRIPDRPTFGLLLAIGAYGLLLILTQVLDYPLSMIGTGEVQRTNDSPPSIALLVLATGQIGLLWAFRKKADRWLRNPRLWGGVTMTGSVMMTVYLWHMTAMIIVGFTLIPTGIWPIPERVDGTWWLLRLPWIVILIIVLAALVTIFGRFERPPNPTPIGSSSWALRIRAFGGAALSVLGLTLLVNQGLYLGEGLRGLPWIPLLILATGFAGLDAVRCRFFRQHDET